MSEVLVTSPYLLLWAFLTFFALGAGWTFGCWIVSAWVTVRR